jgi:hypothetical protein
MMGVSIGVAGLHARQVCRLMIPPLVCFLAKYVLDVQSEHGELTRRTHVSIGLYTTNPLESSSLKYLVYQVPESSAPIDL